MKLTSSVVLAIAMIVTSSFAKAQDVQQSPQSSSDKKIEKMKEIAEKVGRQGESSGEAVISAPSEKEKLKSASASTSNSYKVVIARNILLPVGEIKDLGQVALDFTGSEEAALSISSVDFNSDLSNVYMGIFWASPGDFFVMTDFINGNTLASPIGGGVRVHVYGSSMKVLMFNGDKGNVTVKQFVVYTTK